MLLRGSRAKFDRYIYNTPKRERPPRKRDFLRKDATRVPNFSQVLVQGAAPRNSGRRRNDALKKKVAAAAAVCQATGY